ncbi:MAG: Rieske 2Fe-2S domain-containing protein [Gammaproteobacteria bacterium]|nr:Rieske 2Fe-2S domain-containing protein [Gammaproteobacteria bacterium]
MHNQTPRFPFPPFPSGIYAIAFSHEIKPKQVVSLEWKHHKLALFRTEQGELGAIDGYCSHLGADLACGGIVKKNFLQCPFHGLQFDKNGYCKAKDHNSATGKYDLKSWSVFEKYGLVFLVDGLSDLTFPEWNLSEWSQPLEHYFKIKSHPQEILENTVDKAHFYHVHRYLNIQQLGAAKIKDAEFTISYYLERQNNIFGLLDRNKKNIKMQLDIHLYGLGLSEVTITLPQYHLIAKQIVCPTPVDGKWTHVRALTSIKIPIHLRYIPYRFKRYFANYLCKMAAKGFLHDFLPDISIWENKKYIAKPHYLPNDGEFDQYRTWAQQFYSEM